MRTIDAILENALATQQGEVIIRILTWNDQADYAANPTTPDHTWTVKAFNIFSTSASATLITENNYILSDFAVFIIERGVLLNGVEYTIKSGLYFVKNYKENYGEISIDGSSYPNLKISIAAGDGTYQQVIEAFCAAIGKTAVFKQPTDAWLDYQFFPTGKSLSLNKAELFENLLKQKYAILVYEESPNNLVFYNQDSYPNQALHAIAFNNADQLAVVSTSGNSKVLTSANGIDWNPQTAPAFANAIAYSPSLGLYAAVGASVCHTSLDGETWTARTIPTGTYNAILWSVSLTLFVAVGINVCATSPDGVTWTSRTIPAGAYNGISTNNALLVAIGLGERIITSTNGINWVIASFNTNNTAINWASGTVLPTTLYEHTATLLTDGRILITGGFSSAFRNETYFGTISGNAITWVSGTALPIAIYGHTATLLSDGRILITGGYDGSAFRNETYFGTISGNAITWVSGTALPIAIYDHTATLLSDGRILVTGGSDATYIDNTYFGTISGNAITWVSGTALPIRIYGHTATLLSNGRILITGGASPTRNNTYFGTISGNAIAWVSGTVLPTTLYEHTATLLTDDRILVTGGAVRNETYFGAISGNAITWVSGTALPIAIYGHTATLLTDGRILTTGGYASDATYFGVIFENCYAITYNNALFICVGVSFCITSPDGATWTIRAIPTGAYYGINYGNSLFIAVGAGVIATSPDGVTWTARAPSGTNTWRAVIYALSIFIAIASDGNNRIATSADGTTWNAQSPVTDFDLSYLDGSTSYLDRQQSRVHYIWRDEAATLHTSGELTDPQWNLGFLHSTALPPTTKEDAYYKIFLQKAPIRLDITDGDKIHFTPYWSIDPTKTIDAMMQVSEHLNLTKSPSWYQEIKSIVMFNSTEGGALPSTIERVAAYTPLVSTGFDGNLSPAVNNLQALAQAVDDMPLGSAPITTAANDFQVGDGFGVWITKTLAQTITILRTSLDSIYAEISHNHNTTYATIVTTTAANDFQVGNGLGAWVKKTLAETVAILRTSLDSVYASISHNHDTVYSKGYAMQVGCASFNPVKSTTYYFGAFFSEAPLTTVGLARTYPPQNGRINNISISWSASTAGSAENISMYIQADGNSATDVLISTVGTGTTIKTFATTSANFTWSNYFSIKIVCPAWATNPTGVKLSGSVFIEV